ncbi:glycerophosphodiester phosphodiesterase [Sphaerochaeta sp.]|uniref:glycerophosphodiester phosphodiesterase n=1 Tax=Sphaerochaeta sp. TaxID=1972642 RepID=UPI002FCC69A9
MQVYAHRGFSGKYPENTMLAFSKAVEAGSDGIELDLHCTKDGKLVIMHDETLKRTTGLPGYVRDYSLDFLQQCNAGLPYENQFGETPIPSFSEYCAYIRDKDVVTNIEIKTNRIYYERIEEKALETIRCFGIEDKVLFSSFNWLSVMACNHLAPHIPCAALIEDAYVDNIEYSLHDLGITYLHPDIHLLDDQNVKACKDQHIGLNVWTVNTPQDLKQLIAWGVDGVITNHPDLCLAALNPPIPTT